MEVTINGAHEDAAVTLKRGHGPLETDQLYVNDRCVTRVTHSRAEDTPVILVTEDELVVEVAPQQFYALDGMDHDWQPGSQDQRATGAESQVG